MSIRADIELAGGTFEIPTDTPRYRVFAEHTETGASVSYVVSFSIEDAVAKMRKLQRDPVEASRYNRWCVIKLQPITRMTVVVPVEKTS